MAFSAFAAASPARSPGAALGFAAAGHKEHSGSACPAARRAVPLKIPNPGSVLHPRGRPPPGSTKGFRARSSGEGGDAGSWEGQEGFGVDFGGAAPLYDIRMLRVPSQGRRVLGWVLGVQPPQITVGHTGKGKGCSGCPHKTEGPWGVFLGSISPSNDCGTHWKGTAMLGIPSQDRRVLGCFFCGEQPPPIAAGRGWDAQDVLAMQEGFGMFLGGAAPQITAGHSREGPGWHPHKAGGF